MEDDPYADPYVFIKRALRKPSAAMLAAGHATLQEMRPMEDRILSVWQAMVDAITFEDAVTAVEEAANATAMGREIGYKRRVMLATASALASGELPKGAARILTVAHDAWCPMINDGTECLCHPTITPGAVIQPSPK